MVEPIIDTDVDEHFANEEDVQDEPEENYFSEEDAVERDEGEEQYFMD